MAQVSRERAVVPPDSSVVSSVNVGFSVVIVTSMVHPCCGTLMVCGIACMGPALGGREELAKARDGLTGARKEA